MASPFLLVFGPQTTWPTDEYLLHLRVVLLLDPRLRSFVTAIKQLPDLWQTLLEQDPRLSAFPGQKFTQELRNWIDHGEIPTKPSEAPNIWTMPFTIVIHLVQYFYYLDDKISQAQILKNVQSGGIQGFCIGLLTALAVACSKNEEDVSMQGAVALRLALCVGAYVDLDGDFGDESLKTVSLAVRWKTADGHDRVLETLKHYPDSYIAVIRDTTDVNVITTRAASHFIVRELSAQDIKVKFTGLEGRCHSRSLRSAAEKIIELCTSMPDLCFPSADNLMAPVRSNSTARVISGGSLHELAVRCILTELANWYLTISAAASQLIHIESPLVVSFGLIESIPSSVVRQSSLKITRAKSTSLLPGNLGGTISGSSSGTATPATSIFPENPGLDRNIAVIGMACKFPGADSIDEFWELLTSGTSMLKEMPTERFSTKGLRRSADKNIRFWGNFVHDIDAFDHRFFKKSSREAASMDPQQRLLLQVAYQAMESSGYFGDFLSSVSNDIGCYLGVCANDYNDNIASHPPNAFSSLGSLRAFLSGKISHFFGWTGPSVTFDTACSSSAVAIHAACTAIASGECSQAIAGGVSLYTSPYFYENLAAASFLSPTGATKPFDEKADGYCRGEGVGLVVLKKLSSAITDGDTILGVIAGSAVNQNSNSTYITVPHSPSQVQLYNKVASLAGVDTKDVSFVEAHGTGTPVGDPIEMESIRQVFGGSQRTKPLHVASVKGNIGHLEGASGIAALIKTLLMIQNKTIPVQANFRTLNPKIPPLELDRMAIPVATKRWDSDTQIACINNYGAAGSNAAMIVCGPPPGVSTPCSPDTYRNAPSLSKYPIFISANSASSLAAYRRELQEYCSRRRSASSRELSSLAFNLASKQNRSLSHVLTASVSSFTELNEQLAAGTAGSNESQLELDSKAKPVVLVFGGQASNSIGLSKDIFDASVLLRSHLDHCNTVLRSASLHGLYPEIFQTDPINDIVTLHTMLFSLQYSCAKSWMDSGLQVEALVGHSFGQLTALCVSGTLSLEDGLKLVSGRASLMEKYWGPERGSMVSIEADIDTVLDLIAPTKTSRPEQKIEIACYNGPTSHVLVGTEHSIQTLQVLLARRPSSKSSIKFRKLNVTHGFHSVFTEPILPGLVELSKELVFNESIIPLETCSNASSWARVGPQMIAEHTRTPVYFEQAVKRLASRLGPCTWVEAGSSSSVTGMVRRALDASTSSSHIFQAVQLGSAGATGFLADATVNLWKFGHKVQFWPFHHCQKKDYSSINLPPYQFEKVRHWLSWVEDAGPAPVEPATVEVGSEPTLLSFVRFRDQDKQEAEFLVDPRSKEYSLYVSGHAVLAEPLCPAPLYGELVSRAAIELVGESESFKYLPCIENLGIKAPLGMNDRIVIISMTKLEGLSPTWTFELTSQPRTQGSEGAAARSSHATGTVTLQTENPVLLSDFSRYERLVGSHRFDDLKADPDSEAMQGAMIYKAFSKVVHYAEYYKGVKSIYSKDREVVGKVLLPSHSESALRDTVTEPLAVDNFVQVAGLHVNTLNQCGDNEVYVCTSVDRIQPGPKYKQQNPDSKYWTVYSSFSRTGNNSVVNDIFVFDSTSKSLVFIVLGAHFTKVLINSLAKVLSRANPANTRTASTATVGSVKSIEDLSVKKPVKLVPISSVAVIADNRAKTGSGERYSSPDVDIELRELLSKVTETPADAFTDDATLEQLGIDSLMVTEVMSEVCKHFQIQIPAADFQNLADVKSLRDYLLSKGCGGHSSSSSAQHSDSEDAMSLFETASKSSTPTTVSVAGLSPSQDDIIAQLAALVQGHLETTMAMTRETNMAAAGLDSLLSIELANDIKKSFNAIVDMSLLDGESTFGDLADMVMSQQNSTTPTTVTKSETFIAPVSISQTMTSPPTIRLLETTPVTTRPSASFKDERPPLIDAQQAFEDIRFDYDVFTKQTGFADFWQRVYPLQARLVLAYTVEALAKLGCTLASMQGGQRLPQVQFLQKHKLLMHQLNNILEDGSLVTSNGDALLRTDKEVDGTPSHEILRELLRSFPQHASEHKLLQITGSKLAECLTGVADPLQLLFRSKENRELLEDVYTNGPMYEAITKLLGSFLVKAYSNRVGGGKFEILELGGGTGGTTKYIVDFLTHQGIPFNYTFTDISGSLVAAARKKFAGRENINFMVLDIEKAPPERFLGSIHTIISTNCIHATRNLEKSTRNIHQMLRPDGFVALVEFTRNMFWFDLVFGLLDGWWLYEDGRKHVLADEWFWNYSMKAAGFKHVTWTDGTSEEARTLRIITGFPAEVEKLSFKPRVLKRRSQIPMETFVYKLVNNNVLYADIYYPAEVSRSKRPIALLIHGGGHVSFTRKEADRRQIKILLEKGFLPVSVDYRFCPEVNIIEGPMTDVRDALTWVRYELPKLKLQCPGLQVDGDRVAAVGWSTGGTLAMSLAFTTRLHGQKPPEAILAFYCPSDFESDWWKNPIYPKAAVSSPDEEYDLLEGVRDQPITSYYPPSNVNVPSMLMTLSDPRWRIILHMNWKAQTLPVLLHGLPSKSQISSNNEGPDPYLSLPQPSPEQVAAISPYAQIVRGNYRTPTFLVHGTADDMIPWQEAERVYDKLVEKGVEAGFYLLEGAEHLFDTFGTDHLGGGDQAIRAGYEFLAEHV